MHNLVSAILFTTAMIWLALVHAQAQENSPQQNAQTQASQSDETVHVTFEARLEKDGPALEKGVEWRIFGTSPNQTGQIPLLGSARGGTRAFNMSSGEYLVHANYGHAGIVRRIAIEPKSDVEVFVLDAGALSLNAVAGEDAPIPVNMLTFDIYSHENGTEENRRLIARNVRAGQIIPFSKGIYHVVSRYGHLNAEVRADLRVRAGKVTNAQLKHRAARITLKLVRSSGGDALADTKWTIVNEAGDLISESASAFPRLVLFEGNYTAIAKNAENIYSHDFKVNAGINRDVEVLIPG